MTQTVAETTDPKPKHLLAEPVPALQMVDRWQLHKSIRPAMNPPTFANWLYRAMRDQGFPQPVRVGKRSCLWLVAEVQVWLAARPRGGVFMGRRPAA